MALPQAALEQLAFPVLGADQIARLRPFAKLENTNSNDVLFEAGQANYNLIVVLKGTTNIVDRANGDHVLKASGPGQFNGELGLLNGQRAFAACIVDEPGQVLLLPPAAVPRNHRLRPGHQQHFRYRLCGPSPASYGEFNCVSHHHRQRT